MLEYLGVLVGLLNGSIIFRPPDPELQPAHWEEVCICIYWGHCLLLVTWKRRIRPNQPPLLLESKQKRGQITTPPKAHTPQTIYCTTLEVGSVRNAGVAVFVIGKVHTKNMGGLPPTRAQPCSSFCLPAPCLPLKRKPGLCECSA